MQFQKLDLDTAEHKDVGGTVRNFRIKTNFGTFDFSEGQAGIEVSSVDGRILIRPDFSNSITISTVG